MKVVKPTEYQVQRGARCGAVVQKKDLPTTVEAVKKFANANRARFGNSRRVFYILAKVLGGSSEDCRAYSHSSLVEQIEEWNDSAGNSPSSGDGSSSEQDIAA